MRLRLNRPGGAAVIIAALCQVFACTSKDGLGGGLPKSLMLSEVEISLNVGETFRLEAIVSPEDASDKTIRWSSTNPARVSVDDNGLVKGLSQGTAYVLAETVNALKASCLVTVGSSSASYRVSIFSGDSEAPETVYGYPGMQMQLSARTDDGEEHSFTWSSSDGSISVSNAGLVGFGLGAQAGAEGYAWYGQASVRAVTGDGVGAAVTAVTSISSQLRFGSYTSRIGQALTLTKGRSATVKLYWFDGENLAVLPQEAYELRSGDTSILTVSGSTLSSTGTIGSTAVNLEIAGQDLQLCTVNVQEESTGGASDVESFTEVTPEW